MRRYLVELEAHHEGRGSMPVALSTPEAALALEGAHGPIITFTTFSRELNADEHFRLANHFMGLLSMLPRGGVIVASGGTMGSREDLNTRGGGVGIVQSAAMSLDFKTLSITAASGFKYRAAPANYLLFSLGGFGSESRLMYELSKALIVIGGGGQAYTEATEYLLYNPTGLLIVIDDDNAGSSSNKILHDSRFQALAEKHPNIIIAKTGSEAGIILADRLGIKSKASQVQAFAEKKLNVLSAYVDYKMLLPGAKIIGFSGWSDFSRAGPDLQENRTAIVSDIERALHRIHETLAKAKISLFFATAGNDPHFTDHQIPAFESIVHRLPEDPNVRYLALTASEMKINELNPRVSGISFVSQKWADRTQQLVARVDAFITAGGNKAVIDQSIQAANLKRPHIHIMGGNTLTDMRMSKLNNPNLKLLGAKQVMELNDEEILRSLGFTNPPK